MVVQVRTVCGRRRNWTLKHILERPTMERQRGLAILQSSAVQGSKSWPWGYFSAGGEALEDRDLAFFFLSQLTAKQTKGCEVGVWSEDQGEATLHSPPTPSPTSR